MARIIEARAVISAQDKTGGVFAAIGRKMAEVARASARANAVASRGAEIAEAQGRATIAAGRRTRADAVVPRAAPQRGRSLGSAEGLGAYAVGGLAGIGAYDLGRKAIAANAAQQHERVRMESSGMSAVDMLHAELEASKLSKDNPAFSQTDVMHMLRNARSVVGSYEEAAHIMEPMLKLRTVALGANPHNAAALSEDFDKLIKGMEIKGVTQDLPKFTRYMDGMAKAINTFGDTLRPTDYYEMFKYGRQATTNLSEKYMNSVAPTLAQELGGSSAGTAQAAFFRAIVGGKMSNLATNELDKVGLLDPSKIVRTKTGNVKGVGPGGVMGSKLAAENPYEWVQQYLLPAFKKAGITDPHDIQERIARVFSNQVAAQMVGIFATQQGRIEKDARLQEGARGLESAKDINRKDPLVAWEAFKAQATNLATVIGGMEAAAGAMNNAAVAMGTLADYFKQGQAVPEGERSKYIATGVEEALAKPIRKMLGLDLDSGRQLDLDVSNRKQALSDQAEALERQRSREDNPFNRWASGPKAFETSQRELRERQAALEDERVGLTNAQGQIQALRDRYVAGQKPLDDIRRLGIHGDGGGPVGGFGAGGAAFGFGPRGTAWDIPLPPPRPADLSGSTGAPDAIKSAIAGATFTAALSAVVSGEATIVVKVEAGSALLSAVAEARGAARLTGQLTANGPGGTGRSSPDAAPGSTGVDNAGRSGGM